MKYLLFCFSHSTPFSVSIVKVEIGWRWDNTLNNTADVYLLKQIRSWEAVCQFFHTLDCLLGFIHQVTFIIYCFI